ncbi:MAG: aldehyde dehydrogenase [Candidatus Thiodiazotropha sp.]
MGNTAFFAVLIVLILGILYVMKSSDNPPETNIHQTPKEYIEMVEKRKAERLSTESRQKQEQQSQSEQAADTQR